MAMSVLVVTVALSLVTSDPVSYESRRARLLAEDEGGGDAAVTMALSAEESVVDAEVMRLKRAMIDAARTDSAFFPPRENFLTSRIAMEGSRLFPVIQNMAKGGLLHVHQSAMVSVDWLVNNVTYRPNLFMCVSGDVKPCVSPNVRPSFHFSSSVPAPLDGCNWTRLSDLRREMYLQSAEYLVQFDTCLHQSLSMVTPDPDASYPDLNSVWDAFESIFDSVGGLISHTPVFRDYVREALTQLMDDNVQYLEIRGSLSKLYELNGTVHTRNWTLEHVYRPLFREFQRDNPDFIGAKLILTAFRGLSPAAMLAKVQDATALYVDNRDLVVGFDLVGQEDRFGSLLHFKDALLWPSCVRDPPVHLPFFFHAGETVWYETATDENLIDALLLNTTRIGHGFALYKHDVVLKVVVDRNIAVEVAPISNQVLKLVQDLRNHPGGVLLEAGVAVVIASDDPALWDALPLTHDFYVTLLALAGEDEGLATLKRLAQNSIRYSAMTRDEKETAMVKWTRRWNAFITEEAARIKNKPTVHENNSNSIIG